jgi:hypothetical protein
LNPTTAFSAWRVLRARSHDTPLRVGASPFGGTGTRMTSRAVVLTVAAIAAAAAGCARRSGPSTGVSAVSWRDGIADSSWLAREPVVCGEVRGRVLDAGTGRPLPNAYVTVDSIGRAASTDTLGVFRIPVTTFVPGVPGRMRPVVVRVRYLGMLDLKFDLPSHFGYVIEASLGSLAFHADHITTLRIKSPGFCVGAT